jgi:hypothetical protein
MEEPSRFIPLDSGRFGVAPKFKRTAPPDEDSLIASVQGRFRCDRLRRIHRPGLANGITLMTLPGVEEFEKLVPWIWIGGGALALTLLPGLRKSAVWTGAVASVALGAALYFAVSTTGQGHPDWPPVLFSHRVLWGVAGAILVGLVDSVLLMDPKPARRRIKWLPRIGLIVWFLWAVPESAEAQAWHATQAQCWMATLGVSLFLLVFTLEATAEKLEGPVVPLLVTFMAAATSLGALQGGHETIATLSGILAGSFAIGSIFALLFKKSPLPPGALSLAGFVLGALWVWSRFFPTNVAPPPKLFYLLLLLAPVVLLATLWAPSTKEEKISARKLALGSCVAFLLVFGALGSIALRGHAPVS